MGGGFRTNLRVRHYMEGLRVMLRVQVRLRLRCRFRLKLNNELEIRLRSWSQVKGYS